MVTATSNDPIVKGRSDSFRRPDYFSPTSMTNSSSYPTTFAFSFKLFRCWLFSLPNPMASAHVPSVDIMTYELNQCSVCGATLEVEILRTQQHRVHANVRRHLLRSARAHRTRSAPAGDFCDVLVSAMWIAPFSEAECARCSSHPATRCSMARMCSCRHIH